MFFLIKIKININININIKININITININLNINIRVKIVTLLYGLRWERIVLGANLLLHHLLWLKVVNFVITIEFDGMTKIVIVLDEGGEYVYKEITCELKGTFPKGLLRLF